MIVLAAVQIILALMTISPTLNEQFSAIVSLRSLPMSFPTSLRYRPCCDDERGWSYWE